MSVFSGLNAGLDIIEKAGKVLTSNKNVNETVLGAASTAARAMRVGGSIMSATAQTQILSRSFIDESILDEPILPNLNRSLHEFYAAQIICALHLQQLITDKKNVSEVLSIVQTGQQSRSTGVVTHAGRGAWNTIRSRREGLESFMDGCTGEVGLESYMGPKASDSHSKTHEEVLAENEHMKTSSSDVSVRSVSTSDNRIGPMGELYEVKITNPTNPSASMTVPIFIQMQPSIVPADIAPRFIDMNVTPSFWQRWTQMRAGELSFWRDFLLHRDLGNRYKSVLKDPKTAAAFSDFLHTVAKKDKYAIGDATDHLGARESSNLANSVVIFSEDTVAKAKADSGIDLHNHVDRLRYFRDTYTMIIVVIDPLHQRVTIYFNGMDDSINSSYSDFRPKDSKFDPKDFMVALSAFSTNNISRLR